MDDAGKWVVSPASKDRSVSASSLQYAAADPRRRASDEDVKKVTSECEQVYREVRWNVRKICRVRNSKG